jgi:hypothetical protein
VRIATPEYHAFFLARIEEFIEARAVAAAAEEAGQAASKKTAAPKRSEG